MADTTILDGTFGDSPQSLFAPGEKMLARRDEERKGGTNPGRQSPGAMKNQRTSSIYLQTLSPPHGELTACRPNDAAGHSRQHHGPPNARAQ